METHTLSKYPSMCFLWYVKCSAALFGLQRDGLSLAYTEIKFWRDKVASLSSDG